MLSIFSFVSIIANVSGVVISISGGLVIVRYGCVLYYNIPTTTFKIKPIYHSIASQNSYGMTFDFIYFKKVDKINFILGIEDFYSFKKWSTGIVENYYPNSFFNFTINLKRFLVSFEYCNSLLYGLEYKITDYFSIRTGYNRYEKISYGIGINTDIINLNYAYVNTASNEFEYVNQFSLLFKLNGLKKIYKNLKI